MQTVRLIAVFMSILTWSGSVHASGPLQETTSGTSRQTSPDRKSSDDSKRAQDTRLAEMMRQAGIYELKTDGESPHALKLYPKPLLRFNNPVGGVPDGIVVMWLDGARPAVLAQVFLTSDQLWIHEMQSMAAVPLVMRDRESNRVVWQPRKKGLKWHAIDNAETPSPSKVGRRIAEAESERGLLPLVTHPL